MNQLFVGLLKIRIIKRRRPTPCLWSHVKFLQPEEKNLFASDRLQRPAKYDLDLLLKEQFQCDAEFNISHKLPGFTLKISLRISMANRI